MEKKEEYKVSKIVRKNQKYLVYFDDSIEEITLNEDQIVEFRIIVGNIFTKSEYNKIKKGEKIATYYNKAIHYIDFKQRSKKEVYDYLLKLELDESTIESIIKRLINIKYIDDDRYAKSYISELIRKGKGKKYIIQTLTNKGIDKSIINNYLGDYLLEEERENALRIASKMINTIKKNPIKKQQLQITNKLLQEGYSFEIVSYVMGKITLEDESDELLEKEYKKLLLKETDKNKIITKLLTKGFEYSNIRKIVENNKYN